MRPVQGRNTVKTAFHRYSALAAFMQALRAPCLITASNNIRGRRSRGRTSKRSNRSGSDSVGRYFGDAWSLAKRTAVGLNEIRKLINVEHKFIDVNTDLTCTQTGTVGYLTSIGQGDNITDREGDSIKVQSFSIRGHVRRDSAAASTAVDVVRLLVVRDLQNQGAAPTAADVLETLGTSKSPYQYVDFLNGNDLNKRFTIVWEYYTSLDLYHPIKTYEFSTNHDCHVFYRGSTSAQTSAGNGTYYLIAVSSANTATPILECTSRLRFTDN